MLSKRSRWTPCCSRLQDFKDLDWCLLVEREHKTPSARALNFIFSSCHHLKVVSGISDTQDYYHVGNALHINTQESEPGRG